MENMERNTKLVKYNNGNYMVTLDLETGTMIRYSKDDELRPEFPDSMDVKITNRCDRGCPWCHERSTANGAEADYEDLIRFIDSLPPYTQLALGGGNVLSYSHLQDFLSECKKRNLVPSITVNQKHLEEQAMEVWNLAKQKLVYGVGISLENPNEKFIQSLNSMPNAVVHVIAGIVSVPQLRTLAHQGFKILILGYKNFGRGKDFLDGNMSSMVKKLQELRKYLPEMIADKWFKNISFDNLALEQLKVKNLLPQKEWDRFYMGDDGTATMYVDMVKKEFAKSSTSDIRYPLKEDVRDMLEVIHKERE